jgi:hypothetical protein
VVPRFEVEHELFARALELVVAGHGCLQKDVVGLLLRRSIRRERAARYGSQRQGRTAPLHAFDLPAALAGAIAVALLCWRSGVRLQGMWP